MRLEAIVSNRRSRFLQAAHPRGPTAMERVAPLLRPAAALTLGLAAICLVLGAPAEARGADGKWELVSNSDGVRVTRKQIPGSNMLAFRGVMTANVHISKVVSVFVDPTTRRHWVDRWDADRELAVPTPMERIYWIRFDLPFPVSDRDYVLHAKATRFVKRRVFTAKIRSVQHKRAPQRSGAVRGVVESTYYKFEALPGGERTKLTVEVHTDPRGMLPAWLVNIIQKKWPYKTLRGLVRVSKGAGVKPHTDYLDWHTPYVAPPTPAPQPAPGPQPAPAAGK